MIHVSLSNLQVNQIMEKDEDTDAIGLLSENLMVDETIKLDGIGAIEAISIVELALKNTKATKIHFKFALADGSGPTLFAPIGNLLRAKLKEGKLVRVMPAAGGGWIARIK